jgi:DivIVA domain-containing protein
MVLLTIAVVGGVAAVAAGAVSGGLGEPVSPIPARGLPEGPPTGQDVADLRFVRAFRGYRMDQVDAAMDGLAAEIERLRALSSEGSGRSEGSEPAQSTDPPDYRPHDLPPPGEFVGEPSAWPGPQKAGPQKAGLE